MDSQQLPDYDEGVAAQPVSTDNGKSLRAAVGRGPSMLATLHAS